PIPCERISGLARVLRGNAVVGFEDVPLWHERDISHSSAERVVLADSTILLDYMLAKFSWVMEGLVVRSERMRQNLDGSQGLPFSGRVLLALVEAGLSREDAYVVVQRNAMQAWESGEHLRDLVLADPDATSLDAAVIEQAFSLDEVLSRTEIPFGRLGV
ncbi:MAG: adenylosuccinate lyase, partial [Thermoleophilia bacterium]|nr:adenylosuccinate lyase [Thermoleophilia bacterium]